MSYVTADTLANEGYANITLTSDWDFPADWDLTSVSKASVSVGIYDLATGEAVSVGGSNMNPHYLSYGTELTPQISLAGYAFGNYGFPAGTYSFVAKFRNSETGKTFEYSDTILILPNQTTSATVSVPNVIDTVPDAPGSLAVSYSDPSDEDIEYYLADFHGMTAPTTRPALRFKSRTFHAATRTSRETARAS